MRLLVLAAISAAALACWRKRPYLPVGWLWYLGMLVPVIGLVQIGAHAMADRYTYLPEIGLCIALAWLMKPQTREPDSWRAFRGIAAAAALAALAGGAWRQTTFWRDSRPYGAAPLPFTSDNVLAHNNLGMALMDERTDRRSDRAIPRIPETSHPIPLSSLDNLGVALERRGRIDEAIDAFHKLLAIKPDYANAHCNLGVALERQGRIDEAISEFREALRIDPFHAGAHCNLGAALARQGRFDEAIEHFRKALELKPNYAEAHVNVGGALANRGRFEEAAAHFQKALEIDPRHAEAWSNLGLIAMKLGRPAEAIANFRKAVEINPDYANAHYNLGLALAEQGKIDEARLHFRKALALAKQQNNDSLAKRLEERIRQYEAPAGRP